MYKVYAIIDKKDLELIEVVDYNYKVLDELNDKLAVSFNVRNVSDSSGIKVLLWRMIPSISVYKIEDWSE